MIPDIKLSSGRTVTHSLAPNGSTIARIAESEDGAMSNAEWREYCELRAAMAKREGGSFFIA